MQTLVSAPGVVISQKKEWGEILSGFEFRNRYLVLDPSSNELAVALEKKGSMLLRIFLKALRPFTIEIATQHQEVQLTLARPFRFFFHELDVRNGQGVLIGKIQRKWALFRRIYSVLDTNGREIFELFGPILHPWTFQIKKDGVEVGKITKRWSGALKETFTDSDNFGVTFPAGSDLSARCLLVGAVFLIDFVHFENRK